MSVVSDKPKVDPLEMDTDRFVRHLYNTIDDTRTQNALLKKFLACESIPFERRMQVGYVTFRSLPGRRWGFQHFAGRPLELIGYMYPLNADLVKYAVKNPNFTWEIVEKTLDIHKKKIPKDIKDIFIDGLLESVFDVDFALNLMRSYKTLGVSFDITARRVKRACDLDEATPDAWLHSLTGVEASA